jgi:hypothetical protein
MKVGKNNINGYNLSIFMAYLLELILKKIFVILILFFSLKLMNLVFFFFFFMKNPKIIFFRSKSCGNLVVKKGGPQRDLNFCVILVISNVK